MAKDRGALLPVAVLAALCALPSACSDAKREPTAGSSSAPTSAAHVDREQHCQNVCARAVGCGIEAAERLSRTNDKEVALIKQLKHEREASTAACASDCGRGAMNEEDRRALLASSQCLEQTTCDLFSRCLADVPGAAAAPKTSRAQE